MFVEKTHWDDLSNYRNSLEHYGVKGMRWGIRKQRESSGNRRSSQGPSILSKKEQRLKQRAEQKAKTEREKAVKKAAADKAKAEKRRKDILTNPSKLYKHRNEFTYDEIRRAMERFEWEKKLNSYSADQLRNGAEFVNNLFKLTNSGINLYNSAARIVNSINTDGDVMPFIKPMPGADNKDKKKK